FGPPADLGVAGSSDGLAQRGEGRLADPFELLARGLALREIFGTELFDELSDPFRLLATVAARRPGCRPRQQPDGQTEEKASSHARPRKRSPMTDPSDLPKLPGHRNEHKSRAVTSGRKLLRLLANDLGSASPLGYDVGYSGRWSWQQKEFLSC